MKAGRLALLLCAVVSCARCDDSSYAKTPFTIEEAVLGKLSDVSFLGKWISDHELEYMDKAKKTVNVFDAVKNQISTILQATIFQKFNTTQYEFSPDRKFVLLTFEEKPVFRHSKTMKFAIHSPSDGKTYTYDDTVQVVEWGPRNNSLVFIRNNDLYLIRSIDMAKMDIIRVTKDGRPGTVFNGIGDWVYEEEILSSRKAFWISPEGDQLAFVSFYDKDVLNATIEKYGEPGQLKHQYTEQINFRYPKAGTRNPTFIIRYISFKEPNSIKTIPVLGPLQSVFINLRWLENHVFLYTTTNRVQNSAMFFMYSIDGHFGETLDFLNENNPKGWANTNLPLVSKDESRFLRVAGSPVKNSGRFKHLLVTHRNRTVFDVTRVKAEVLKIVHWDEPKRIAYVLATEESSATSTQLYAVSELPDRIPTCLSCGIVSPEGQTCKDVSASFSKKGSFILLTCNGPNPKMAYVYKNTIPLGKPVAVVENNSVLRNQLSQKLMPEVMNLTVEVPGNFRADVRLLLPPNMDRSGRIRYPLVIYVYGGPASKNINDAFKLDWGLYMSTNLGVIYGMIDGRNTLRKGEDMLFAGYKKLGTVEIEDQITVTRLLQNMLCFIDPKRTGIWGWSYGGYATTKVLEMDTGGIFKGGIAVAPVADWIYYDSMYTERYMGLPSENKVGYEKASVLKNVTNLRNKQYFLIHGNADDNVHYQNAMMIAKTLQRENIPFELMSYPDEDHSLKDVRTHLYYTMSRFWKKCFNLSWN